MGASVKLVGKGTQTNSVYEPILSAEQLALLTASPAHEPFDGDARKFRLGIEAMRLGLAYEYRCCGVCRGDDGWLGSDTRGHY